MNEDLSFNFHDSELIGFQIIDSNEITLQFIDVHGKTGNVVLKGVESFRGDNFREGNIVFDVRQIPESELSNDDIFDLFCHDRGEQQYETRETKKNKAKELEHLRQQLKEGVRVFLRFIHPMEQEYGQSVRKLLCDTTPPLVKK